MGNFLHALDTVFNGLEVFELEFSVNDFLVAYRIYGTIHMHYVAIVEAAQYVDDGIRFADISQKLVTETFALGSPFDKTGDVNDFDRSGDDTTGMYQFGQLTEALVGYGDDTDIRFDGAEGEIGGLCLCIAQAVEKSGLAHVRQSDDTTL